MPSSAGYQYVSGSRILTEGTKAIPFPGPIRRNGTSDPELLKAFIRQCQLTSQQDAMDAKDWNNLGYAYANLPTPQLPGAQDAFLRARALTRDPQLLGIINANLTRATEALSTPPPPDDGTVMQPLETSVPLPDVAFFRKNKPLGKPRATQPRKSATRGGKKRGSKGSRR